MANIWAAVLIDRGTERTEALVENVSYEEALAACNIALKALDFAKNPALDVDLDFSSSAGDCENCGGTGIYGVFPDFDGATKSHYCKCVYGQELQKVVGE